LKFKDKIAIVTAASQGIGRVIVLALAETGANVVVNCDRNVDGAEIVTKEILALGRRAMVAQADVSKSDDVNRMVQQALAGFGRVDILVNNAGIFIADAVEDLREEDWDRVMEVNLKGVFLCCQAFGRHMIERKSGGSIINVASISDDMPELNLGAYTPSKAGVLGLPRLLVGNLRHPGKCPQSGANNDTSAAKGLSYRKALGFKEQSSTNEQIRNT